LDDRGKQMVRQLSQRLQTAKDAEELRQMLAGIESHAGSSPPEMKPAIDVVKKKIQARIDELEKAKGKKG
jgi:hypothetical protein